MQNEAWQSRRAGYSTPSLSPRISDSTGRIVGSQVVGQDDSQQLKPDRIVFVVAISATESVINQTARDEMEGLELSYYTALCILSF